jgi:hypothetical protein
MEDCLINLNKGNDDEGVQHIEKVHARQIDEISCLPPSIPAIIPPHH